MKPARRRPLDCCRCGACCCNPPQNREEGFADYVEVRPRDAILGRPELVARYVVYNQAGLPHLGLDPAGRCRALRGAVGRRVRCEIYRDRPSPCRRVERGSELCRRYRREQGLAPEER